MDKSKKIIISGAGIGGLTAAACLLQEGYNVRVYEQAPELGEIGAGIQTSANAVKVLHHIGLADRLEEVAVRPKSFEFRLFNTGEVLHKVPLAAEHEKAHGAPYYHIHRSDIHKILADRVLELDPDAVILNSTATGFSEDADGVTLNLSDGRKIKGDILIGADGIKSPIRDQIVGVTAPDFTGQVAWRATVDVKKLPEKFMDKIVAIWCGPKKHAVVYYLRSGNILNFVGCVENDTWTQESWTVKASWDELKADFAGWNEEIQTIIDAIDKDQCYRWALNNRKPVYNWSTKRATILGDAAHPTLPYMASGAVMAIEDAAVLMRSLNANEDIAQALDMYTRNRVDRTARIVLESTEHGDLYHLSTREEFEAGFGKKNIAKERGEWLYSYDPMTVELK
ncbi:MAG: NAD(P)-binding protein [Kordiimonadaceae bacterium]|jgi:salicylate hydroxylase|nr:NAD(P)-binding protein [Kordiimonadaceae bacterium]MBT6035321.1 NAD(P)-binding protein [Kordiimonadaceae bacterium]MBT6330043.1 NAD(P)-binding protein [Kordiimonadaceae bacterium]